MQLSMHVGRLCCLGQPPLQQLAGGVPWLLGTTAGPTTIITSTISSSSSGRAMASTPEPDGKIGADEGELADMLDATLADAPAAKDDGRPTRLLTTRREALALYREVLRYSNLFVWRDDQGRVWRDVIRASARAEYEAARWERDPHLINRMIITGREAVQRAVTGFMAKRGTIIDQEAGRPPGGGAAGGSGGSSPWAS